MKKLLFGSALLFIFIFSGFSQNYSPVTTTGYTLDAVAENTTALATTSGALDGSNYVLYSAAYGAIYSVVGGLPNSGFITSGTYTYQLQPYNQNNVLFVPLGQTDSLTFTTPASYASISLLAFGTEGNANMNITIRFTDNTTQAFSNLSLFDWFNGTSSIINGFGRCGRLNGTITNVAGQPKMFNVDLNLTCANRLKLVRRVIVNNISANARVCVMAASGALMPSYSGTTTPVACVGGTNGTASVSITNPLPPTTYTWNSTPNQFTSQATNLTAGVYSYTVNDAAGCAFSSTVAVGISTVPLSPLMIGTSATLVCPGTPLTLSTFGANTYTWSNSLNSPITSVTLTSNSNYSVAGTTAANCLVTGSISINVYTVAPISFTSVPPSLCVNSAAVPLQATPQGGTFNGPGIAFGVFNPNMAGAGTYTISYSYTDVNSCTTVSNLITTINPLPVINFSVTPSSFCLNSPTVNLVASPNGGVFNGQGVSGSVFSPSVVGVGTASMAYSYTDANTCSNSAQLSVTVNALPSINFTPIATSMCLNAASITLNASPSGGTFSGAGVINGTAFSASVAGVGPHVITYAYTNSLTSCSAVKTISTSVSPCTGLSTNLLSTETTLLVYPNPSSSDLFLNSTSALTIRAIDEQGKVVFSGELNTSNNFSCKLEDLTPGLYFIVGTSKGEMIKQKVIICR